MSSCRFCTSLTLSRADGIAVTCTSYAAPPEKMSLTSSLAIKVDACRRMSPGCQPELTSFSKIGFDLDVWQIGLQRSMSVFNPRDVADALLDVLGLLLQRRGGLDRRCAPRWTRWHRSAPP